MEVIKVSGKTQEFNLDKIVRAVNLANKSVDLEQRMDEATIQKVVNNVVKMLDGFSSVSVDDIHDMVERSLMKYPSHYQVAKEYITYRDRKKKNKKFNEIEEQVLAVIDGSSNLRGDNANKRIDLNSSARDYIAGIACKSIANKTLPKKLMKAHKDGLIHWHDLDYSPVQKLHNCDLINVEDMFVNGFQMGDTRIEPNDETPFETACNLLAQINLQVSSCQYGGQTVSWSHLLPYIDKSRKHIRNKLIADAFSTPSGKKIAKVNELFNTNIKPYNEKWLNEKTEEKLREEIYKGVKTYQYQVLCHSSANGQTPFVSNNLCLREAQTQQELDDFVMLIEEIFKRRIKGVKDSSGHYISPLFPKLLYWTCDGLNVNPEDPYYELTRLAARCELMRTQPDIVSEKETRRVKKGQIIPSMGCRSLLGPTWETVKYSHNKKFYYVDYRDLEDADGNILGKNYADWTEYLHTLNLNNMTDTDYENCAYPYGKFVDARDFRDIPNGKYPIGFFRINFRGNTGWMVEKDDDGVVIIEPKVYGRWNNGVITINIPYVALEARKFVEENGGDKIEKFFEIFTERMNLVREGLKVRHKYAEQIQAKNSPILWQHGAITRMQPEMTLGEYMIAHPTLCTISIGYVGLYETCEALIDQSNTTDEGRKLSKMILEYMNTLCNTWKASDKINYAIYGTPEESLTYKFAMANRKDFGLIPKVTDKDYVVNSYHVDPREHIDAFKKIEIEGEYLALSSGGAVSYVEILDHTHNVDAIVSIIQWMHKNIVYAEFNKKIAVCHVCGHEGGIDLVKTESGDFKFICPVCGNSDDSKMDVTARLCGYLGKVNAGNTNKGRLDDIYNRVIHTDCVEEFETEGE